ncbi:nitrogen regulation protein NR(II) [Exilibacterium tricleocarpae]|uniref:Sensory histidine kinase/phosphatase NtrB n=1 Tax=Exilibacterium tricleocarpae TaxID=2591008 RepID=A0A545ST93_9GAMM|nr:nitrogen regulation protein NR(II) [Exilibacterium tricleocarpae]TQV68180.1 nitrogen regulation protein NR(II) [Exilibacterium tricleocarpae]
MASDANFKQLLDSLNTAVLVVDGGLCLRHLNSAAEMLLEVSSAQVTGTPIERSFYESDAALETLREAAAAMRTYTKRRTQWQLHNGHTLTVDYSVTPISDQGGLLIEVQPLDRLLRISREEALSSAQETTRNLVRSMAHEIKNPLGGIRGAAQLLARELPNQALEEYTRIIIDEADRLRKLVDKMLGPRQPLQWEPVNVHEVLERVATVVNAECAGNLRLERDYDPSIPDLPGDKEQLIQAVLNIVRNALQALREADMLEDGCITLQTRVQRQFTIGRHHHPLVGRITVIDNGPGIPAKLVKDIFYPMISGRAEGTGLGLAISQQLVNQHCGLIECESRPGCTAFSIYLPLEHLQSEQQDA